MADEGNGDNTYSAASGTYTAAAAQTTAGLQKWVLFGGTWKLAYTLSGGLHLGAPYTVPRLPDRRQRRPPGCRGRPRPTACATSPAGSTANGTATIWAITSTVSGGGDQGADPNKLVAVTDRLAATRAPAESFTTVRTAGFGEVLRGVSFTPGTGALTGR